MAFAVTRRYGVQLICLAGAVMVLAAGLGVDSAQALGAAAPFKPPVLPSSGDLPVLAAAAPEPAASDAVLEDLPTKGLFGIRRGPRSAALIDGEWIEVGQQVRGARLLSVTPQGAQLGHPDGRREFLELNPEVRWTPHRPAVKEGRP